MTYKGRSIWRLPAWPSDVQLPHAYLEHATALLYRIDVDTLRDMEPAAQAERIAFYLTKQQLEAVVSFDQSQRKQ